MSYWFKSEEASSLLLTVCIATAGTGFGILLALLLVIMTG